MTAAGVLTHEALLYRSMSDYVSGTVPFVTAGLDTGQPVLVAVPAANGEVIREALGGAADKVRFLDMTEAGRNPGRIIPGVLHSFVEEHAPGRVRIIGEPIWAGRSAAEYPACVQHEALINLAFADAAATILCPYDTGRLGAAVIGDAERTHPVVVNGDCRAASDRYGDPTTVVAAFNRPFAEPVTTPVTLIFDADELPAVRRFVVEHAGAGGLDRSRVGDLAVAVNEVATNAVIHGGGPGTLRIWKERGGVVCELSDPGQISDPLAGRIPPPSDREHGRGLLLVHHMCDLVQMHTGRSSTTIRLHMRL